MRHPDRREGSVTIKPQKNNQRYLREIKRQSNRINWCNLNNSWINNQRSNKDCFELPTSPRNDKKTSYT